MYDKLMLSRDCSMYNQYSTAWLVTYENIDISAVERIHVKWDWQNRHEHHKHTHWITVFFDR
jgi:hypothetical protein